MKTQTATICIDISGSVGGNVYYWTIVKSLVERYREEYKNQVHYVLWDSNCKVREYGGNTFKSNHKVVDEFIRNRTGCGGTDPVQIVTGLQQLKVHSNICIITDGEVDTGRIDKVDKMLETYDLDNVECHIVAHNPNLSVTCPFTRKNTSKIVTHTGRSSQTVSELDKKDYELLDSIADISYDNFLLKFATIKGMTVQACMGRTSNEQLKEKFMKLKARIVRENAQRMQGEDGPLDVKLRRLIQENKLEDASKVCTGITKLFYKCDDNDNIISQVDSLIQMCNGSLRYAFNPDQVQSASFARATYQGGIDLDLEELRLGSSLNHLPKVYECPISYDVDVPSILVKFDPSILTTLDKFQIAVVEQCPLRILHFPNLVEKIKACLQHSVGLQTVQSLEGQNPFTRDAFNGCISLICSDENVNHLKFNDYQIANMICQGKRFGNLDLWFFVLYYVAKSVPFLEDVLPAFEAHLRWRFSKNTSYASLNGLGSLPTTVLPIDLCCYYICSSFEYVHSPKHDTIRFHLPNMDYIKEIVGICFGPNSLYKNEELDKYVRTLQFASSALEFCKRGKDQFKLQKLLKKALVQNFMLLNKENKEKRSIVLLDGPVVDVKENPLVQKWPELEVSTMYGILDIVNPGLKLSDINIKLEFKVPDPVVNWKLDMEYGKKMASYRVPISPKTFRPLTTYVENGSKITWKESCKKNYNEDPDSPDCFKATRYFIEYVIEHKKIPTFEEFASYAFSRIRGSSIMKKNTLPIYVREAYEGVYDDYRSLLDTTSLSVEQIADLMEKSIVLDDRIRMESA